MGGGAFAGREERSEGVKSRIPSMQPAEFNKYYGEFLLPALETNFNSEHSHTPTLTSTSTTSLLTTDAPPTVVATT